MCKSGDAALGVTLRQTLTHDENGEKLIYYPQKADELYAVQTGQTVPVLTRGVITINETALEGSAALGAPLMVGDRGQFTADDVRAAIRPKDSHFPQSRLVVVEYCSCLMCSR